MAEQREATVLFVDDDLIEKLLRGDSVAETPKPAREVQSNALAKAIELVTAGKLDEAIEELNKAAESGKHVTDIHATLGHLWFEKRNWAEAAKHYHAVVEKDVKHQTAHYNFGLALQRQEKFEEAATEFETALVIDPKRWQAHFGRGLCLLNLRRVEEAVAALDAALQEANGQNQDRILAAKAVALQESGKLDEAAAIYQKLLPGDPNSPDLLANLIAISIAKKDDNRTKELAERLIKVQPDSRHALEGLTAVATARGDFQAAAQHASQLVKAAPDFYDGHFHLGVALHKTGRLEQAANAYQQAATDMERLVGAPLNNTMNTPSTIDGK